MRRTYASKKDTGGGLDHKDLILTVDERSSAFDAYYIRNIKQTKRELSSIVSSNQYGAVSKKVRKRKYVKRIVKDIEPAQQESISRSVFLTPDKSIHVKKELDPFDMLLNSSTVNIVEPDKSIHVRKEQDKFDILLNSSLANTDEFKANKSNLFESLQPKRVEKRCLRRKVTKVKKYSYSSEDSTDSNKENSNDTTSNTSDIRSHKLVIEQVTNSSPKRFDESINNIVTNIASFNNCRNSSGTLKTSFKFRRNRLTASNQSPILQKSPLCSTPFKAKYRGDSIFKFSPINLKDDSPCFVTVVEEQDNDDNNIDRSVLEGPNSPISHLHDSQKCELKGKSLVYVIEPIDVDIMNPNSPGKMEIIANCEPIHDVSIKIQDNVTETSQCNKTDSCTDINALQTTEIEPFFGFSINSEKREIKSITIDESHDDTIREILEINNTISEDPNIPKDTSEEERDLETSHINISHNNVEKLHMIETNSEANEIETQQCDNIEIDEIYDNDSNANDSNPQSSEDVGTNTENSIMGVDDETYDISSLSTQDDERESSYNTCSGEGSLEEEQCPEKEPLVVIERMNDSLFLKYYQNYTQFDYDDDDDNASDNQSMLSDEYASLESESDEQNASLDVTRTHLDLENEALDSNSTNLSSNEDSICEDKCISFVTTRRRNEVTNNSLISIFNNSYTSSSTDCEKTVLSNIERTLEKSDLEIDNNGNLDNPELMNVSELKWNNLKEDSFVEDEERDGIELDEVRKVSNPENCQEYPKMSVTTRKTSKASIRSPESSTNGPDFKPTIVLQPGKKWERSLSIYRRMTMMTDHFDQSILEEEPMETKGRKYRQSVISTMELQEFKGPLHNESFNNRRSTFVSKPNRSTIRILKDPDNSRISLCTSAIFDDLKGFLTDECDDTLIELSKLSIADAGSEVTVLNLHDTSTNRITTARDYVLRRCNQTEAIIFDECYPDSVLKNCHKIGEGVYGEVFLWRARDGRARVMKIVPVAGELKVNGEHQKDFHEIISEIVIAMELSALRTPIADIERHLDEGKDIEALDLHTIQNATDVFNEVLAVRCVYGVYPSRLLDLWELFDECKGSENDNPAVLPPDQQYIVLELANAGLDLESYQFNNAEQAHALFLQVALALAVGEEAFQFEHRDLHWGNVLIAPSDQKFATFVLRGRTWRVARCGVAATIIDYSLSRLSAPLVNSERAALYNDLASDDGLFDAVGDYQFQVYRLMRDKLGNDWKNFEPYTNILWLHYTLDKMITALRYKRTTTKIHKHYIEKLKAIKNRILDYGSAVQFVLTDNEF